MIPTKSVKSHQWFVISTAVSLENKIKTEIEKRITALSLERKFKEIVIPIQKKIVISNGKQKIKEERLLPGYIFINMVMDKDTFSMVRNIEGVKGFISAGKKPMPLTKPEVENMMQFKQEKKATFQKTFKEGDAIKVIKGDFNGFIGNVKEANVAKGKVKILITIFGRETPVELDFNDVQKL